jgi:hypothetical protein
MACLFVRAVMYPTAPKVANVIRMFAYEQDTNCDCRMKINRLSAVFGALAIALAGVVVAQTDPATADTIEQTSPAQIQKDVETQAAMAQAIEKMKMRDADQAAAQDRYSQSVEGAKAEHRVALDKCKSLVDQAEKSCKEGADAELSAAKSKAERALEAHTSAQP